MGFIFNLIKWSILTPFKLVKFILVDILVVGVIGGMFSIVSSILRFFFRPLSMAVLAGGALVFFLSDEERRNKVKALIGA